MFLFLTCGADFFDRVTDQMMKKLLLISSGEPAGIGPDLCLMLAERHYFAYQQQNVLILILADMHLLRSRAKQLNLAVDMVVTDLHSINDRLVKKTVVKRQLVKNQLLVWHVPSSVSVVPGQLHQANADYVLRQLKLATQACLARQADGLITCPVHKGVINQAGHAFSGHTEYLQKLSRSRRTVMMLANPFMRVALVTTHLPLSAVAKAINAENLEETILITAQALRQYFAITRPRITLAGLNPHAGENGYLGTEEQEVMLPLIKALQKRDDMELTGPVAADTMFVAYAQATDCFLAMYHDQGLAVIKYADFAHTVNITLGLPFVRTSVDHGTALDLAGTGKADPASLLSAIDYAVRLNSA